MIHRILFALALCSCWAAPCLADLLPEEVAIIAAKGNRESEALAKYYAKARNIPAENICLVDVPKEEVIPRDMWQWGVRPEIQKWLKEHDPKQKIRCLVTMWGVPLKIGPATADASSKAYQAFLEGERAHRVDLLGKIRGALEQVAPKGELSRDDAPRGDGKSGGEAVQADAGKAPVFQSTEPGKAPAGTTPVIPPDGKLATQSAGAPADQPGGPSTDPTPGGPLDKPGGAAPAAKLSEIEQLRAGLEKALQDAQMRLSKLPSGDLRSRGQLQLHQLASAAGGGNVILQGINQRLATVSEPEPALKTEFDALRGRTAALAEVKSLLDQTPPGIERDALELALMERLTGIIGTVEWIDAQLTVVRQNESGSAFDSELSLVMWPDNYQLLRWQPNYLRPGFDNSQLPKVYRTLMVARIDAPTLALAKGLIDTSIKVEKEGLRGKAYFDNRGIANIGNDVVPGSYADFDRSLLITAKGIDEMTDLDVVVESTPKLFQAGECKDAALYCGWYSLGNYVDAFEWKPGAVAYHLASFELDTLRSPDSHAWCKKLLEDGVCVTIGPVYEPYLVSFPRPNEFFAMLLQGNMTLVECYYRSSPFNSWMMSLVGDPLYKPFKYRSNLAGADNKPALSTGLPTTEPANKTPAPPAPR